MDCQATGVEGGAYDGTGRGVARNRVGPLPTLRTASQIN